MRHSIRLLFLLSLAGLRADDLMPLGDEFDDASTQARWSRLYQTEGWVADQLERWAINPADAPGRMVMTPRTSSWFANLKGVLVYKEISGDFVVTTSFEVRSRHNPGDPLEPPARSFDLAGIFVRAPRSISSAAPTPTTTSAVWPPADHGSDWTPGGENYIFLSYGSAGNPGTRQYEVKTTLNSVSTLYYRNYGVPDDANITLQLVRVGQTLLVLRRHPGGPWIIENRYQRSDFPATLQVGLTTYTDWDTIGPTYFNGGDVPSQFHHNYLEITGTPDLEARFDYLRFQRPSTNLTEALLASLPVTYLNGPIAELASTTASNLLGEAVNQPLGLLRFTQEIFGGSETGGAVSVGIERIHPGLPALSASLAWRASGGELLDSQALHWTNGAPEALVHLLSVTNDGIAEGTQTSLVVLAAPAGPFTLPGGFLSTTARVEVLDAPADQWRWEQFGTAANSPAGQLDGDWDQDGAPNLWEAAAGTDARSSNALHRVRQDAGDFLFEPLAAPPTWISLSLQGSSNLLAGDWQEVALRRPDGVWTSQVVGVELETLPLQGVRAAFTNGLDAVFLRLGLQDDLR